MIEENRPKKINSRSSESVDGKMLLEWNDLVDIKQWKVGHICVSFIEVANL